MAKQTYVTTAIDYVNGSPHLGHAYEKVVTDAIARARASLGEPVFFLTGLDEHGQKVEQAASAEGMEPQAYVDHLAEEWRAFAQKLGLRNDDFIRTSEPRHREFVQKVLQKLYDKGEFYQAEYKGFYSTRQESFLTDRDRREDGTFDPIYGDVLELSESNYYFRLSAHQEWLIEWIESNPEFIAPSYRRNEVLGFLKNNTLEDLCISRPKNRLSWGIPLPFDPDYVTYVWFDALTNYLTVPAQLGDPLLCAFLGIDPPADAPELWPADRHVIGKDIIKFHAVYWPIMLKAMELPLPKQITAHGWWQKDGEKMSKTTGNIVDPVGVVDGWGLDAFRFYALRELDIGPDGNWTDEGFAARYQAELANGLGNLVNRSLSMLKKYRQSVVPARNDELATEARSTIEEVKDCYRQDRIQAALTTTWRFITRVNQYVDQTAPFKLAKDPDQQGRLDEVLYNLVESVRLLPSLIQPAIPQTADRLWEQLALDGEPPLLRDLDWGGLPEGHVTGKPSPLFPRRDP